MTLSTANILKEMDKKDQEKVSYFINLLLNQTKYKRLKEEISNRREEIKKGEVLDHDQFWSQLNV